MNRFNLAALLAFGTLSPAVAQAAPITVVSGTRGVTIGGISGPVGQSFVATDALLSSFGFQFAMANNVPDATVNFSLLSGAGLSGSVIATRSATLSGIAGRTGVFFDFNLTGTVLTLGQAYTAVVSAPSTRLALIFGPTLANGVPVSGDAYAAGSLYSTAPIDNYCTTSGACDANFRTNALASAVPEPASWAMLILGFATVGGMARQGKRGSGRRSVAIR